MTHPSAGGHRQWRSGSRCPECLDHSAEAPVNLVDLVNGVLRRH